MKKCVNAILALVMTVMCCMTLVLPTLAEELPEATIPVSVTLEGTLPDPAEDFKIVLKADEAEYPMPEGTLNGSYTITVTGAGEKNFPAMTYDHVGIYTYTVHQVAGIDKKCTYDDTVYDVTVTITNKEDFSGLEATVVIYNEADGEKVPAAAFHNVYEEEPPYVPQTGDDPVPDTGDNSSLTLYIVLLLLSLGLIVTIVMNRRLRNGRE